MIQVYRLCCWILISHQPVYLCVSHFFFLSYGLIVIGIVFRTLLLHVVMYDTSIAIRTMSRDPKSQVKVAFHLGLQFGKVTILSTSVTRGSIARTYLHQFNYCFLPTVVILASSMAPITVLDFRFYSCEYSPYLDANTSSYSVC